MADILLVGEPMGIFIAEDYGPFEEVNHFSKGVSGAEVNVAFGLSRLGYDVNYVTKLGQDPFGDLIVKRLKDENVKTDYITFDEVNKTGIQLKNKVKEGDPRVTSYRRASAFSTLTKEDVDQIDLSNVQLLHLTGIPIALNKTVRQAIFHLAEKAKEQKITISFDPNLRPMHWEDLETMIETTNKLAEYAHIILPGIEEAKVLMGSEDPEEIADFYFKKGVQTVIMKNGSDGAFVKEQGKDLVNVSGYKAENVVDTVGAGDGFAVGVITGTLEGLAYEEAVKRGNAIGSLQVQVKGDNEGLPKREELDAYMKET